MFGPERKMWWEALWTGHVARMGEVNCIQDFGRKPEEGDLLKDLGIEGRTTLEWILGIHLVQDRDQWRAFLNTVMSLRVP